MILSTAFWLYLPLIYTLDNIMLFSLQKLITQFSGNGRFHFILLIAAGCSLLGISNQLHIKDKCTDSLLYFKGVVMESLNMAIVLPAAKCDIEITTTEQGLINAVGFIGVVLTSHFWGFM